MVIDSSVILAILLNEQNAEWAASQLDKYQSELLMSTVNLTEVLIVLEKKKPKKLQKIKEELLSSNINFVAPDTLQAQVAAMTRIRFPINLGDCFAYALAIKHKCPLLTLDSDFKKTDADLVMP